MENNCFILKLKDSVLGNYDKLNFLKVKVFDKMKLFFSPDKVAELLIIAEDCTFTLKYFNVVNATDYTFKRVSAYSKLDIIINGNGYLYVGNKYNLGYYNLYDIDLDKIYSYDKAIKFFIIPYSITYNVTIKGSINHLLSLCSSDLTELTLNNNPNINNVKITGDITLIGKFINLQKFAYTFKGLLKDIAIFSPNINLTQLVLFNSDFTGNIEELALTWYNNGKTIGTVEFLFANTNIIVPATITSKVQFYCTFTESGYTFSLTKPNT